MIKSDITAYIGSYALDGVIEIPSKVLTSTVQDEEINLSYTPNFQLKLNDSYGYFNAQCMKVDFTVDSYEYSAYMYKVNSAADGTVTVQYAGGLEQGETPEPEPEQSVAPTMYYDENTFTVSATGEGTVIMYLDETEIENPYTFAQTDEDVTYTITATAQQDGKEVSDIVSIECFVPAASQPDSDAPSLYILGNVNGQSCGPNIGTEMNFDSSQNMYTLTITAPANEAATFIFSTQLASQGGNEHWADIANYRYGAMNENYQVQEGYDSQGLEHSTYYFEIQAGTEYNISIDSALSSIEFEQVMPEESEE